MKFGPAFLAFTLLAIAACETTEVEAPPPVVAMSEAQFASALSAAKRDADPYAGEKKLTYLVQNNQLAADQRARALYARATQRWKKSSNKAGALADFDEFGRRYPSNTLANNARIERGYVQNEVTAIQRRMQGLQTLDQWFDDAWSLGERDKAAARYKKSGLSPEKHQAYAMERTGYICRGSGAKSVHNYGPRHSHVNNLYWCR